METILRSATLHMPNEQPEIEQVHGVNPQFVKYTAQVFAPGCYPTTQVDSRRIDRRLLPINESIEFCVSHGPQ
jgi:hypothetical protein